ncbi:hypothetical protein IE077_002716, partial [Cardiosporidium cionae]
ESVAATAANRWLLPLLHILYSEKSTTSSHTPPLSSKKEKRSPEEIIETMDTLITFFRTAPLGEFKRRLQLLECCANLGLTSSSFYPREMGGIMYHIARFVAIWSPLIEKTMAQARKEMDKQVEDLIKLTRWDLSNPLAMKETVRRTHHQLRKITRKFDEALMELCDHPLAHAYTQRQQEEEVKKKLLFLQKPVLITSKIHSLKNNSKELYEKETCVEKENSSLSTEGGISIHSNNRLGLSFLLSYLLHTSQEIQKLQEERNSMAEKTSQRLQDHVLELEERIQGALSYAEKTPFQEKKRWIRELREFLHDQLGLTVMHYDRKALLAEMMRMEGLPFLSSTKPKDSPFLWDLPSTVETKISPLFLKTENSSSLSAPSLTTTTQISNAFGCLWEAAHEHLYHTMHLYLNFSQSLPHADIQTEAQRLLGYGTALFHRCLQHRHRCWHFSRQLQPVVDLCSVALWEPS